MIKQIGHVHLIDTTLRDGNQSPDCCLTSESKIELALLLDSMKIYQIEAGIPAVGKEEREMIRAIAARKQHAKIAVWNRMNIQDILHASECHADVIHISVPISDRMLNSILKKDRTWLFDQLDRCVSLAMSFSSEVTVGFQDASRADIDFIIAVSNCLYDIGVRTVRLADTVGILTPSKTREFIGRLMIETDMKIGIHTHNDLGMAEAIALEAVKSGASTVDTTLFGIGERAGNCDTFRLAESFQHLFQCCPSVDILSQQKEHLKRIMKTGIVEGSWLT